MKDIYKQKLLKSKLFAAFSEKDIDDLFFEVNYEIKKYSKDEIIAFEGDEINKLSFVLQGVVNVEKTYVTGKVIKIKQMKEGGIIGLVNVFSNHNYYPSMIVAKSEVTLLYISQKDIIKICTSHEKFLLAFIGLISDNTLYLNKKLKFFSYKTIREKLTVFILDEYKKQNNLDLKISLKRKEMAEDFGVSRPALSKELIKMKDEGLIEVDKGIIIIKDIEKLEDNL